MLTGSTWARSAASERRRRMRSTSASHHCSAPTPPPPKAVASTKEDAYEYTVKSGNRLLDVIKEYNVELKKNHMKPVTLKEVLEANPGLKPNLLIEGKKILIPARPAE